MIVRHIQNQKGFSLPLILAIAALFAITGYTYAWYQGQIYRQMQQTELSQSISNVQTSIYNVLNQDASWVVTVQNNAANNDKGNMGCLLQNGVTCNPQPVANSGNIDVFAADGTLLAASSGNQGFHLSGQPCTTFGDTSVADDCIFQFQVTWSCYNGCAPTVLPAGQTVAANPIASFVVNLIYQPKTSAPLPVMTRRWGYGGGNINPPIIRGQDPNTIAGICALIGATFNPATQLCTLVNNAPPQDVSSCPIGQFLTSYDLTTGAVHCQPYAMGVSTQTTPQCPAGVASYNSDGSLSCAAPGSTGTNTAAMGSGGSNH